MLNLIRRKLRPVRLMYNCLKGQKKFGDLSRNSEKVCWLIGPPEHRNLGDHAIAYATIKFVQDILPDYEIIEITEETFYDKFLRMKKLIKPLDIILLQGGGNFGNLYQYIEDIRRVVITSCKKNPIIMMPQSVYFTPDKIGEIEKKKTEKLYGKNNNLYFFAREKISEEIMKEFLDEENISCVPDIVLWLNNKTAVGNFERNGILFCLRDDVESKLNAEDKERILEIAQKCGKVECTDTIDDCDVPWKERHINLEKKWTRFATSKVVITDRLHGLIFAAITNTPCVVFSNNNHKIRGVCDWLSEFSSIIYVNSPEELTEDILLKLQENNCNNEKTWDEINKAYEPLRLKLLEAVKNG